MALQGNYEVGLQDQNQESLKGCLLEREGRIYNDHVHAKRARGSRSSSLGTRLCLLPFVSFLGWIVGTQEEKDELTLVKVFIHSPGVGGQCTKLR